LIKGNLSGLGGHGFGLRTLLDAGYNKPWEIGAGIKLLVFLFSTFAGTTIFNRSRNFSRASSVFFHPSSSTLSPMSAAASICCGSFMIALYLTSESINYRWILMILVAPSLIELSLQANTRIALYFPVALFCLFLSLASLSLPFDASFYIYTEWIQSFIWHPFVFGTVAALLIESLRFTISAGTQSQFSRI